MRKWIKIISPVRKDRIVKTRKWVPKRIFMTRSSNTRTARNTIKGIWTGDGTASCGRGVGIIMDGEHRCVELRTNGVVGRFWELLQDLWMTPESLKTNPQLPYDPLDLICRPWTTYHLHHRIFVPITQSLYSHGPWLISETISSPHHCPYLPIWCYDPTSQHLCKIRPFQGMIVMLWFLTTFYKCFDSHSFNQLIKPPKKHHPPFLSSPHHNVFAPLASNQYWLIGLMQPHSFHS